MKTIKITYTEVLFLTNEKTITVSDAVAKKLQNENSAEYAQMWDEMHGDTVAYETGIGTEVDDKRLEIEII